jgi:hypothetical protein
VQDSGIAAGLMLGRLGFLLDQSQSQIWAALAELPRGRQADDASTNYDDPRLLHLPLLP